MAKFTRIKLKPDDPIFTEGLQVFVPVSRPPTQDRRTEVEPQSFGRTPSETTSRAGPPAHSKVPMKKPHK